MTRHPNSMPITDETLNAYVDGELSSAEAAQIARHAASVPAIANRIAVLHQLKAGVAGIADDMVMIDPPMPIRAAPPPRARGLGLGVGLASMVAAVLLAVSVLWVNELPRDPGAIAAGDGQTSLVAQHDAWANTAGSAATAPRITDWLDDLMQATGLSLVHAASYPLGARDPVQHFAFIGPNGCRLSLFEAALPGDRSSGGLELAITPGLLTASWAAQGHGYTLVARDMDRARFVVIATAIHDVSLDRGSVDDQLLASLRQARQPCLG